MMKKLLLLLLPCVLAFSAPLSRESGDLKITVWDSGDLSVSVGGIVLIQSPAGLPTVYGSYATSCPSPARTVLKSTDARLTSSPDGSIAVNFAPRISASCQKLMRTVAVAAPQTFTIVDTAAFSSPADVSTAVVTAVDAVVRKIDDTTFIIAKSGKALRITLSAPADNSFTLQETLRPSTASRLGVNCIRSVREAHFTTTISIANPRDILPPVTCGPTVNYDLAKAVTVEAEAFIAQKGGAVKCQIRPAASGQAFMNWDNQGHTLTWEVNLPHAGQYAVLIRGAHPKKEGVTRSVSIDDRELFTASAPFIFPCTGGWSGKTDNWQNCWLATAKDIVTVTLSAGKHTITMVNQDNHGLNLDWIKFVPLP